MGSCAARDPTQRRFLDALDARGLYRPIAEARRAQEAEAEGTNDAVPYYEGILADEPDALVRSFVAGKPVLDDPLAGRVEGTRELRSFVAEQAAWLRERDAVVENVALTRAPSRTVEEVVLNLLADDGSGRVELPVAVVADRNPDRTVKVVRVYHSTWPLTGEHRVRLPLLPADPNLHAEGAPGEYQRALAEGYLAGIVATFEPDGYAREPSGAAFLRRGTEALYELYGHIFANSGGIPLEHCTLADDGVRCAIEYNCVRWGDTEIPPQAGVAVYERGGSGLLAAARIYDDVDPHPSRTPPSARGKNFPERRNAEVQHSPLQTTQDRQRRRKMRAAR